MDKSVLHLTQTPKFKGRLMDRFKKIAEERERLGLPKAVLIDGVVHKQFPDGRLERVELQKNHASLKSPDLR
ncbi:hypothetical protein [Variovorax sp. R-27]|uniref:hypothetical protein n=1 Tax=Variovorax sp. R-27 TaxID=3404058 RepID=UPI003CECC42B